MNSKPSAEREKKGVIVGSVGLILNLLLGGAKLAVGILTASVAIMTDAVNNLSDAGTSLVTVGSFMLSKRRADKEHPYGHGRYEYIAGFLISVVILMVGGEFFINSVEKIISPSAVAYGAAAVAVLGGSVAVKLAMGIAYTAIGKRINSETLKAAAFDSFSDCMVTGVILLCILLGNWVEYPLDGVAGVIVATVVLIGGIKLIIGTVGELLGKSCTPETAAAIEELVTVDPLIIGIHDLHVHDYGPGRTQATVHAEIDEQVSLLEAHKVVDAAERRVKRELGIEIVIHADPVDGTDETQARVRKAIKDALGKYSFAAGLHDLHIDYSLNRVEFDIRLPYSVSKREKEVIAAAENAVGEILVGFAVAVTVDFY